MCAPIIMMSDYTLSSNFDEQISPAVTEDAGICLK